MPDIADHANDHIEMELALLIRRRQKTLSPCGFCFYCEERINDRLFCDVDCASDYEREQRIKSISGR